MIVAFKKVLFIISFNSCLFLTLIIGIQNSSKKSKVNLIWEETVKLPISFIVGTSFISGSILGSIISISFKEEK